MKTRKRRLALLVSAGNPGEPRTETVVEWMNRNNIRFIRVQPIFRIHRGITRKLTSFVPWNYIALSLVDAFFLLLATIPLLLFYSLRYGQRILVIVCFGSPSFFPFSSLLAKLPFCRVAVDLGYPAADLSGVSDTPAHRRYVSWLEKFLDVKTLILLAESRQQKDRILSQLKNPKVLVHYNMYSLGKHSRNLIKESLPAHRSSYGKYIVFRGTLNPESGIKSIISSYLRFLSKDPPSPPALLIYGRGGLEAFVNNAARASNNIYFSSEFLGSANLVSIISNATACVGQFGIDSPRINYTIPHKYIESLALSKLYMCPYTAPMIPYLEQILGKDDLARLAESASPFEFWLNYITFRPSLICPDRLERVSREVVRLMMEENDRTLKGLVDA